MKKTALDRRKEKPLTDRQIEIEDIAVVREHFPESAFRDVLAHPPPGVFDPRSWSYWHVRFGLEVPPALPKRQLP